MQQLKFVVSSGKLYDSGSLIGLAYSGNGKGLNNPQLDSVKDVGPIPIGKYSGVRIVDSIVIEEERKGPIIFGLSPDPTNDMKGRSGFMVHWDNKLCNFSASEGCIVPVMAATFYRIDNYFELEVIASE